MLCCWHRTLIRLPLPNTFSFVANTLSFCTYFFRAHPHTRVYQQLSPLSSPLSNYHPQLHSDNPFDLRKCDCRTKKVSRYAHTRGPP